VDADLVAVPYADGLAGVVQRVRSARPARPALAALPHAS
jgi:hypothetical protein